uniref:Alpha-soluble NSF attachment protein n=1 Tax=Denticeps clupeoides TaxID=299321 RepID=A0AAY4DHY5_9TELE
MDHSAKEKGAAALVAEADKKVRMTPSFLGSFFGSSSKVEEACDMYVRAANMYKMAKNWNAAGSAFTKAARLRLQAQSKHDAAAHFIDAGHAFKKSDPEEAIKCLSRAIEIYTDMGRFTIAAKHHVSIAEIYESELLDIDKAVAHYEQAGDYYKGEESTSAANKMPAEGGVLRRLSWSSTRKAVQIYEQIGTYAMDHTLLKYGAKDHFFKAALCHFCVDMLNAKLAVEKYEEMFPAFSDCRECKLVKVGGASSSSSSSSSSAFLQRRRRRNPVSRLSPQKLLDAHEEQDVDAFTDAVSVGVSGRRARPPANVLSVQVKDFDSNHQAGPVADQHC